jgi:hypothetical protein
MAKHKRKSVCKEATKGLIKNVSPEEQKRRTKFISDTITLSLLISLCTKAEVLNDIFYELPSNLESEVSGNYYPLGNIIREGQIFDSSVLRMTDIKLNVIEKRTGIAAMVYVANRGKDAIFRVPLSMAFSLFVIVVKKIKSQ